MKSDRLRHAERAIAVLKTRLRAEEAARKLLRHEHEQQASRNLELEVWRRQVDRWRWMSIGAGLAGGGLVAMISKALGQ